MRPSGYELCDDSHMFAPRFLLVGAVLSLFLPIYASSTTLSDLQAQLTHLMDELSGLQTQSTTTALQRVTGSREVGVDETASLCLNLTKNLSRGMKDGDVIGLQQFLKQTGYYSYPEVTGYFGSLTEAAVKKFQCKHINTCSGSSSVNGYGIVGPKTRGAILRECQTYGETKKLPHTPPASVAWMLASTTLYAPQTIINQDAFTVASTSLTKYPRFSNACMRKVIGYAEGGNILSPALPWCLWPSSPLMISVTHTSNRRTHWYLDSRGSKVFDSNFIGDGVPYMHDYVGTDVGSVFRLDVTPTTSTGSSLEMALDTLNYPDRINITGRDYRNGYLFMGLNDLSVSGPVEGNVSVRFSFRVREKDIADYGGKSSGHRIVAGALFDWPEFGRSNTQHHLEFNLYKSAGFHTEHLKSHCPSDGKIYDYCFYDESTDGVLAESKHVPISAVLESDVPTTLTNNQWYTVHIPLSSYIKSSGWQYPPSNWSEARFAALYFGIESKGSSRVSVEIKDYEIVRQ